jgi:valyl-tRNA synthetase
MHGMLKLLHPFMPFITEEIWQVLTNASSPLMLQKFPVYDDSLNYSNDEENFEKIIDAIKAIRNRRTEMDVPPSIKAKVFIETDDISLFEECSLFFQKLAFASSVKVSNKVSLNDAVTAVTDSARIFIPLDELVDKEKELARLNKEKIAVQKDIDFLSGKLNNQGFVSKAPKQLIETEKIKLKKAQERMNKLLQSIEAMKK